MRQRFIFLLVFFSSLTLLPGVSAAPSNNTFPLPPETFLKTLDSKPDMRVLYDFFDIYDATFTQCKELPSYMKALRLVAANGDSAFVRSRLQKIANCENINAAGKQTLNEMAASVGIVVRYPGETATPPPPPGPDTYVAVSTDNALTTTQVATTADAKAKSDKAALDKSQTERARKADKKRPEITAHQESSASKLASTKPKKTRTMPKPAVQTALSATSAMPELPAASARSTQSATNAQSTAGKASVTAIKDTPQIIYRSGDSGTSRFMRWENITSVTHGDWTLSGTTAYLDAGKNSGKIATGSEYMGTQHHKLRTHDTVFTPQLAWKHDIWEIALGTTPLGATADPLPVGKISLKYAGVTLTAFQEAVTDSLLSYVGFTDPYSNKVMGRVVKAGGRIAYDTSFATNWFFGTTLTGAYLYGSHVEDNSAVKAEMYIGRTFGPFAAGVYTSYDHFEKDLSHFTYGHGGYYSPQQADALAGFVSWEHKADIGWIKLDTSIGYLYEETDNTDLYYHASGAGSSQYQGASHNRLTLNSGFESGLNLGKDWTVATSGRYLNSGQFHEIRGGLNLRLAF